jgi:hypothetical protein
LEAGDEALVGVFEGEFGLDAEFAGHVDGGKEEVAEFVLESLGITGFKFEGKFGQLLTEFVDDSGRIWPVEADAGGLFLDIGGADEGGEGARDAVHDGHLPAFLFTFDLFPLAEDRLGVGGINVAENVRVAADEFLARLAGGVLQSEGSAFGGEIGVEDDLEEEITEFFAEVGVIRVADGVDRLAGFLEESGAEGFVGLLAVPGATFGRAEEADDGAEAGDGFGREFI